MRRPDVGEIAGRVDGAQPGEELARRAPGGRGRRLEPGERVGVADAERGERQHRVGQVGARDLGRVVGAGAARSRAACRAAARGPGACARRARRAASAAARLILASASVGRPGPGRVRGDARQPRVDHRHHAVDGHRRLGDVGGQHHLAAPGGPHGARLLLERHLAVQRQHASVAGLRRARRARPARAGFSPAPGRNTSRSPSVSSRSEPPDRRRDLRSSGGDRRPRPRGEVLDRDLEAAPLAAHGGAVASAAPRERPRTGSASSVADIATTASSGRGLSRSRRSQASARSVATWRSCSSSSTTAETPRELGIGEQPPHEQPLGDEPAPACGDPRPRRSGRCSRRSRRRARRAPPPPGWRPGAPAAAAARAPRSPPRPAAARRAGRAERGWSCRRRAGPPRPPPPRRGRPSTISASASSIEGGQRGGASSSSGPRPSMRGEVSHETRASWWDEVGARPTFDACSVPSRAYRG